MPVQTEESWADNILLNMDLNQEQNNNNKNKENKVSDEEEKEEDDEDIIPPETFQHIQNKLLIKRIEQRMFNIEQCYFNPQTLTIQGYNQLRNIPGQHWKSRLYTLFNDAYLPHYWILDIWASPSHKTDNEIPVILYVQLITFQAKMFVKSVLTEFFAYQNSNINIID